MTSPEGASEIIGSDYKTLTEQAAKNCSCPPWALPTIWLGQPAIKKKKKKLKKKKKKCFHPVFVLVKKLKYKYLQ